jgi:hypothetical protein
VRGDERKFFAPQTHGATGARKFRQGENFSNPAAFLIACAAIFFSHSLRG